jgi:hypothetical protein
LDICGGRVKEVVAGKKGQIEDVAVEGEQTRPIQMLSLQLLFLDAGWGCSMAEMLGVELHLFQ